MPSVTTVSIHHTKALTVELGINVDAIDRAVIQYGKFPVVECSDEARALRYLEPRCSKNGSIELVGKCWDPNVDTWHCQSLQLPAVDQNKGDVDE